MTSISADGAAAPFDLKPVLTRLADGADLDGETAKAVFDTIMDGQATPAQIAAFLMGLRMKGETVEELVGAVQALRARAATIAGPPGALDTCGTGGDNHGTYNISTTVAFVLAGCGLPVAKHGNRAASSRSGAADVLSALGVNIDAPLPLVEKALTEANVTFLMAPKHHAAMRHVVPVRKDLGLRTLFNVIGPLANPAGASRQLLGVYDKKWLMAVAEVLKRLGTEAAWVVRGHDGLDELSISGPSDVVALKNGQITQFTVTPGDAGLPEHALQDLKGGDGAANAEAMQAVLAGLPSAYRDIVLLNAAAALVIAEKAANLKEGAALAAQSIDSGAARAALDHLIAITNSESAS